MVKKKTDKKSTRRKKAPTGDVITVTNVGAGSAVAAGRGSSANVVNENSDAVELWALEMGRKIDKLAASADDKGDLKHTIEKISEEIQKGPKAEKNRLEKLINTLSVMSSDIFEVVVATLQSPLGGVGMVIRKIGNKARLEKS